MAKKTKCQICDGHYTHGSAIHDFYSCGHAFEKPLTKEDGAGRWLYCPSPYLPTPSQPEGTKGDGV